MRNAANTPMSVVGDPTSLPGAGPTSLAQKHAGPTAAYTPKIGGPSGGGVSIPGNSDVWVLDSIEPTTMFLWSPDGRRIV